MVGANNNNGEIEAPNGLQIVQADHRDGEPASVSEDDPDYNPLHTSSGNGCTDGNTHPCYQRAKPDYPRTELASAGC
ncbi:hypothetical protein A2U01_0006916 [Trifolium medium]|uniref:Uncharacterized protein n=1 Tax=Trifolium medium TaxID=97028 RepID=A0A392MEZ8_9FABA|nr:hypothetical protein [Trifolium medium]